MIYLLHSTVPVGGTGTHSARHYMGFSEDKHGLGRVRAHQAGKTKVPIVRAFLAQGGHLLLVALLPGGTRTDERKLKTMGHMARLCPLCSPGRKIGWPNGMVSLIPRRGASTQRLPKPTRESGGALPLPSLTPATSPDGVSRLDLPPVFTTPSGERLHPLAIGGLFSAATAPGARKSRRASAGTKPVSSGAGNAHEE